MKRGILKVALGIFLCFLFLITASYYISYVVSNKYNEIKYEPSDVIKKRRKNILYWNKLFGQDDMGLGLGSEPFKQCEYTECYTTNKLNYLPLDEYDAIVFHAAEYHIGQLFSFFPSYYDLPPKRRSPHQVYAFLNMESPVTKVLTANLQRNFYNATVTYRRDSDVIRPYGYYEWEPQTGYRSPTSADIEKRDGKIAWFVSNCESNNNREDLFRKINKYLPIDVYGACGTFSCPRETPWACYEMLERKYKFYLSFENSNCVDYVTEKLFRVLNYNVVPIVYGGANYTELTPPNSVINVLDFESIRKLVDFLKELDRNPVAYLKYFEWKQSYVMKDPAEKALCDLCKKLHNWKNKIYHDIKEWWHPKNTCWNININV